MSSLTNKHWQPVSLAKSGPANCGAIAIPSSPPTVAAIKNFFILLSLLHSWSSSYPTGVTSLYLYYIKPVLRQLSSPLIGVCCIESLKQPYLRYRS